MPPNPRIPTTVPRISRLRVLLFDFAPGQGGLVLGRASASASVGPGTCLAIGSAYPPAFKATGPAAPGARRARIGSCRLQAADDQPRSDRIPRFPRAHVSRRSDNSAGRSRARLPAAPGRSNRYTTSASFAARRRSPRATPRPRGRSPTTRGRPSARRLATPPSAPRLAGGGRAHSSLPGAEAPTSRPRPDRRLRGRDARDRHAVGRAGDVVDARTRGGTRSSRDRRRARRTRRVSARVASCARAMRPSAPSARRPACRASQTASGRGSSRRCSARAGGPRCRRG